MNASACTKLAYDFHSWALRRLTCLNVRLISQFVYCSGKLIGLWVFPSILSDVLTYYMKWFVIWISFQVLISIQSLILCAEPYYNEPGFERLYGTPQGDSESLKYSEEVFRNNLKYAVVGQLTNPPEGFEDVVRAHFYLKRDFLLEVRLITK